MLPGQACTHKTERNEVTIQVRDGSSIQLAGEELTMTLEANFVMRDRSRRPHRVERTVASMPGIAARM